MIVFFGLCFILFSCKVAGRNSGDSERVKLSVVISTKRIFAYRRCQPIGDLSESVKRLKLFLQTDRTVAPTFRLTWASWRQFSRDQPQSRRAAGPSTNMSCSRAMFAQSVSIECYCMHRLVVAVAVDIGVNKVAASAKSAKCPPNLYTFPISVFSKSRETWRSPNEYATEKLKLIHVPGPKQAMAFSLCRNRHRSVFVLVVLPVRRYKLNDFYHWKEQYCWKE